MTSILITDGVHHRAAARILDAVPDADLVTMDARGVFSSTPSRVEFAFLSSDLVEWARDSESVRAAIGILAASPALTWLHTASAGVDHAVFGHLLRRGVRLTNSPGIHAAPIAEYVMAHVLAITKRVREHTALQARAEYTPLDADELTGKTVGIVGFGGIGRATARLTRAFGMRVLAIRRNPEPDALVDQMLPPDGLDELLGQSHVVVLAVPLTRETRGLVDLDRLGRLRTDAILVNVSRGEVVDEAALVETLAAGRIRSAVLDVHAEEPLPSDSPLWGLERAVITPHDSSRSPLTLDRAIDGFLVNLRRRAANEPLLGEIRSNLDAHP